MASVTSRSVSLWLGLVCSMACGVACGGGDDGGGAPDAAPVGRICFSGLADGGFPTVIASPALDCPSRLCLHVEGMAPDLCTARCEGDGDCVESTSSACGGGMTCVVPLGVGPFACEKFCVCVDQVPAGGFMVTCP